MDIVIILGIFVILWVIIEVLSIVLKMTGLELHKARFQVISLLTHTGFTTRESELILQHPTRRKIASSLMFISYITQISLLSVFFHLLSENRQRLEIVVVAFIMIVVFLILITRNKFFSRRFNRVLEKLLSKSILKNMNNQPIEEILKISPKYSIYEIIIDDKHSVCGKSLANAKLTDDFIQVLKVDHGSEVIDFPKANLIINAGDKLIVYGKTDSILKRIIKKTKD